MKANAEMILKSLDKYPEMEETAHYCGVPMTMDTLFCQGWLYGAKAAIDAILDDEKIQYMVYSTLEEMYRSEDVKEHLLDFYVFSCGLSKDAANSKLKKAVNDGAVEEIVTAFLDNYDCDTSENGQIYTAIENYYADKEV